jgi:hypothetical protein
MATLTGGHLVAIIRRQALQRWFGIAFRACRSILIDHLPGQQTVISARRHWPAGERRLRLCPVIAIRENVRLVQATR